MFVKRYLAKDMAVAMEKIRKDLGSDAVILSNRPVRQKGIFGFLKKRFIEVMVAYEPQTAAAPAKNTSYMPSNAQPPPVLDSKPQQDDSSANELQEVVHKIIKENVMEGVKTNDEQDKISELNDNLYELKNFVKDLSQKIVFADREMTHKFKPEVKKVYNTLLQNDVHEGLAYKICDNISSIVDRVGDECENVAKELLFEVLGEPSQIKLKKYRQKRIMLIGPTGVGKTTTLVKLAGRYVLHNDLKVGIINTDTYRVAAHEQLKTYADILKTPCHIVYSLKEMEEALEAMADMDVILIDTAGKSTSDKKYHEDIESYINTSGTDEILLAISASTSFKACRDIIKNFSFLEDYKLIITKLDEIKAWGNIANIAAYAKKPVAFITIGQNVPQDIEEPNMLTIAQKIVESDVL